MKKTAISEQTGQNLVIRRNIVNAYFKLVSAGKFKEGLGFFAPDCKTHNPYLSGNMKSLADAQIAAFKEGVKQTVQPDFVVRHVLVDGDMVAAHTEFLASKSNPGKGGLRQVHLFRFEGDKIAEYWDITQQIAESMPNASGAF
jgi:predicted SnoaL-like aldol condensation-catalyzing enzyme